MSVVSSIPDQRIPFRVLVELFQVLPSHIRQLLLGVPNPRSPQMTIPRGSDMQAEAPCNFEHRLCQMFIVHGKFRFHDVTDGS
jgi:hypothetical protein